MTWTTRRLDRIASEVRATVDPRVLGDILVDHYSIPSLDATGKPEVVNASSILSNKQLLKGGEVIVSRLNPRKARVLEVSLIRERPALASGEFVVIKPHGVSAQFLRYSLLAESVRQYLDSRVKSVTRSHQRVRPSTLMKMSLPVPSPGLQSAIVHHLDAESARIDRLIDTKRRMVELLELRLTSLAEDATVRRGSGLKTGILHCQVFHCLGEFYVTRYSCEK